MDNGGPAFPVQHSPSFYGMSLRDWFAGQVIIGVGTQDDVDWSARFAYRVADAMLKARSGA